MTAKSLFSRLAPYAVASTLLCAMLFYASGILEVTDAAMHTSIESVATCLALCVGVLALVQFYSNRMTLFLVLGTLFMTVSCLDGFHAIATSERYAPLFPSRVTSLEHWHWFITSLFLSFGFMVCCRVTASRIKSKLRFASRVAIGISSLIVFGSSLIYSVIALPEIEQTGAFLRRPGLLLPTLLFLIPLTLFVVRRKGIAHPFMRWIAMSLLVNVFSQCSYLLHERQYDALFALALVLKVFAYAFVFIGLCQSVYEVAIHQKRQKQELLQKDRRNEALLEAIPDTLIVLHRDGTIIDYKPDYFSAQLPTTELPIGQSIRDMTPKEAGWSMMQAVWAALQEQAPQVFEYSVPIRWEADNSSIEMQAKIIACGPDEAMVILTNISSLKAHEHQIEAAKIAAEEANKSKSDFLANMSHEIRTPMTAILGFTDILLDEYGPDASPMSLEAISTIHRNGEHLMALINDILDLSKIESGKMSIEWKACSIQSILNDVYSLMKVRADEAKIELTTEVHENIPNDIISDPTRIRQILINLVGNAIKFTKHGCVKLTAIAKKNENGRSDISIAVQDTGIGITKEHYVKLFQPFTQADTSTTRKYGGTGLGLTISQRLADSLHGEITVESEVGKGSIFTLNMNVEVVKHSKDAADNPISAPPSLASEEVGTVSQLCKSPLQNARILLVEDGPDNQRLLRVILEKAGAKVEIAENGKVATDRILQRESRGEEATENDDFDIILMDMQMPVMDGYTATRLLRQKGCELPIIALTAHAMSNAKEECLQAGCTAYVAKPIDHKVLLETIAENLNSKLHSLTMA